MKVKRNLSLKAYIASLILPVLSIALLTGCAKNPEPVSRTGFYFDTVIQITLYDTEDEALLDGCFALAGKYERLFSATLEGSDVWNLNHSGGKPVTVSEETASLMATAVDYADMTQGIVDPTIRPVSMLWDFDAAQEALYEMMNVCRVSIPGTH